MLIQFKNDTKHSTLAQNVIQYNNVRPTHARSDSGTLYIKCHVRIVDAQRPPSSHFNISTNMFTCSHINTFVLTCLHSRTLEFTSTELELSQNNWELG